MNAFGITHTSFWQLSYATRPRLTRDRWTTSARRLKQNIPNSAALSYFATTAFTLVVYTSICAHVTLWKIFFYGFLVCFYKYFRGNIVHQCSQWQYMQLIIYSSDLHIQKQSLCNLIWATYELTRVFSNNLGCKELHRTGFPPSFTQQRTLYVCHIDNLSSYKKAWTKSIKSDWNLVTSVFWSMESSRCLFSNANQSLDKTPCRWKNYFHYNPSGSHWESSYIPWWHYVLQLFSSSAVMVLRKKKR